MKKKFNVPVQDYRSKKNPCHECGNNKYRGGDEVSCDACVKWNNFKPEERKA